MATHVFCIAPTRAVVETIVMRLKADGFPEQDISVLMSDPKDTAKIAHEHNTKAPEGATAGAATGGVLGGTVGLLAGIGALAIPGLGPFIAAGPIMAALAGMGVGAAVGGLTGALIGMGIPEYEAKQYEGRVKSGGSLVSVRALDNNREKRAKEIFKDCGGEDIAATGAKGDAVRDFPQTTPRETTI
ncbi:MAG TPA: general stress protein [Phycisphaerales bacterium]|nr:general stress protein [Phycisphaerales bacterium]